MDENFQFAEENFGSCPYMFFFLSSGFVDKNDPLQ